MIQRLYRDTLLQLLSPPLPLSHVVVVVDDDDEEEEEEEEKEKKVSALLLLCRLRIHTFLSKNVTRKIHI